MSGGIVLVEVSKVLKVIKDQFVAVRPDLPGLDESLAKMVIAIASGVAHQRDELGSVYSPPLDVCLRRLFINDPKAFEDFQTGLSALESYLEGPLPERKVAVQILSGAKQIHATSVMYRFRECFGLPTSVTDDSVRFLIHFGFPEDLAAEFYNQGNFGEVMQEAFLLVCWTTLWTLQQTIPRDGVQSRWFELSDDEQLVVQPAPLRRAPPRATAAPPPRTTSAVESGGATVRFHPRGVPAVVSPSPTRNEINELRAQIGDLTKAVATLASLHRPIPARTRSEGQRVQPAASVAMAVESEGSGPEDLDEDDADDMDLSVILEGEQDQGYLAAGTAAMRGSAGQPLAGESVFMHSPVPPGTPSHYLQGPQLQNYMYRAVADHPLHQDLTGDEVANKSSNPEGLFLLSVNGVPAAFVLPVHTRGSSYVPKVVTRLFNPDGHAVLARLGASDQSYHLFPVTIEQFEANMSDQQLKSMKTSPLFPGVPPDTLIHTLFAYKKMMVRLFDGVFGGHSVAVVQSHKHHVTIWYLLVLFHFNRWMRAMVHGDIRLLVTGFDATWQSTYSVQLGVNAQGLPLVSLQDALQLLCYRCPQCNRPGACVLYCAHDTCRATLTASRSNATPADAPSGYMAAFKVWLKTQPEGTSATSDAAHTAFCATPAAKAKNFTPSQRQKTPKPAAVTHLTCQDRANEQHLIRLHACPNFQYA